MIAGGTALGKFNHGYLIDYRTRPFKYIAGRSDFPATGIPYTRFLCSVMMATGLKPEEFRPYGADGYFGEFKMGSYDANQYAGMGPSRNDSLPFFYTG
jgi:hypothetical protein